MDAEVISLEKAVRPNWRWENFIPADDYSMRLGNVTTAFLQLKTNVFVYRFYSLTCTERLVILD